MRRKKTIEEFKKDAYLVFGDKYDYTKSIYTGSYDPIIIICPVHGEFLQQPFNHLSGFGCRKCGIEANANKKTLKASLLFENKANKIHNNFFNYTKSVYENATTEIIIICPIHGEFLQTPNNHLNGRGCPNCGGSLPLNINIFIERANVQHDYKYDYSKSIFINTKTKLIIVCKKHGEFEQSPEHHLEGKGCPACAKIISKPEICWLNSFGIVLEKQKVISVNGRIFKVDGFDSVNNTIYEFYGDFWHGNPSLYDRNDINSCNHKTYGELYDSTIEREDFLENAGFKIISIWQNDWNEQIKEISTLDIQKACVIVNDSCE